MTMEKQYYVEKGKHDFKPNDQPLLTWDYSCYFTFELDQSMWYNYLGDEYPDDYVFPDTGKPYNGINKLGFGFTAAHTANDNWAGMLGWFPDHTSVGRFDIYGYINPPGGGHQSKKFMQVLMGQKYEGKTIWQKNHIEFHLREFGSTVPFEQLNMPLERPRLNLWFLKINLPVRGIGGWFGGLYPAFKDCHYWANINY